MRRRSAAAAVLVLGASSAVGLAAYGLFMGRTRIELAEYSLFIDKPGLPAAGLTVLHLSDLHLRSGGAIQGRKVARLRSVLAGLHYDLALITGDLIHNAAGFPMALEVLAALHPRLGAYMVWGNHDYCEYTPLGVDTTALRADGLLGKLPKLGNALWQFVVQVWRNDRLRFPVEHHDLKAMTQALRSRGIQPLLNTAVHLQAGGGDFWLAGVDDLVEGAPDLHAALAQVPREALLLLLAHNPDAWLDPEAQRADLVLSGHTHGGQVQVPFIGALHTQGTHLARRSSAGWFMRGRSRMFVTRGVGESLPLRLGARPQVALLRLHSR